MIEDPVENTTGKDAFSRHDDRRKTPVAGEQLTTDPFMPPDTGEHSPSRLHVQIFQSVSGFFDWLLTGRIRMSVTAGIFAGLVVALGLFLFSLRQEEWMLKQKYPEGSDRWP